MILHFSDLHFQKEKFEFVAAQAHRLKAEVCISGDFLDLRIPTPLIEQAEWVTEWVRAQDFRLYLCSGNHDYDFETKSLEFWVRDLHDGDRVISDGHAAKTAGGTSLYCIPYGDPILRGRMYDLLDATDIVVTHEGPTGTSVATDVDGKDWGSLDLRDYLDYRSAKRRGLVLCGHTHKPQANSAKINKTMITNPGRKSDRPPAYFMIDDARLTQVLVKPPSF